MVKQILLTFATVLNLIVSTAHAQVATGGIYTLDQGVVASGGGSITGTGHRIDGTVGQAAAGGNLTGVPYAIDSGFWTFLTLAATSVTSSQNPSVFGQSVTFTATVGSTLPEVTPTGTIQFVIDGA